MWGLLGNVALLDGVALRRGLALLGISCLRVTLIKGELGNVVRDVTLKGTVSLDVADRYEVARCGSARDLA